jgi:hypothetical protein
MKVYFTGSIRDTGFNTQLFVKIYKEIEELGYEQVNDTILKLSFDDSSLSEKDTRQDHISRYQAHLGNIKKADICIFETSAHSLTTGFLINVALDQQKPTIVLYYKDNVPYFLEGVDHEKLLIRSYNDKDLKKVVAEVLEQSREKRDKRFNFFISPKLLEFLEQTSNSEGITKSKLIRNLIVEHMRENKVEENAA